MDDNNDIMSQLAELRGRFEKMDADAAATKRNNFIDSDSQYFSGDRDITGRIFDRLQERGIDTANLDRAAREGIYNDFRQRLNQLSQSITVKAQEAAEQAQMAVAASQQAQAEAQQQVAEMQQQINAVSEAEAEVQPPVDSGIPTETALTGAPMDGMGGEVPADMPADVPADVAPEGGEVPADMPADVPTDVPADVAPEGGEVPADTPADLSTPPLETPTTVSDERLKNVKGEKRLGGETHGTPDKLGGEGTKASDLKMQKLSAWRKSRQVATSKPKAPKPTTVSDRRLKEVKKPTFATSMIRACRGGK